MIWFSTNDSRNKQIVILSLSISVFSSSSPSRSHWDSLTVDDYIGYHNLFRHDPMSVYFNLYLITRTFVIVLL